MWYYFFLKPKAQKRIKFRHLNKHRNVKIAEKIITSQYNLGTGLNITRLKAFFSAKLFLDFSKKKACHICYTTCVFPSKKKIPTNFILFENVSFVIKYFSNVTRMAPEKIFYEPKFFSLQKLTAIIK